MLKPLTLAAITKRRTAKQKLRTTNVQRAAAKLSSLQKAAAQKQVTLASTPSPEETCKSGLFVSATHINYLLRSEPGKGCVFKCIGSSRDEHFAGDKHGAYAWNGYNEIKSKHRLVYDRAVLNVTMVLETEHGKSVTRMPDDPTANPLAWFFDFADNYMCAYHPINHDYHHMLPWSALHGTFTQAELEIIQSSEYNINAGVNLIILPMTTEYAWALDLPAHPHDHPMYTIDVKKLVNGVKKVLKPTTPDHRLTTKGDGAAIKLYFEAWEKEEFDVIVAWGASNPGVDIDDSDLNAMMDAAEQPVSGRHVVVRATLV